MKKFTLYFIFSFLPMVTFAQKDTAHSKTKGIIKIYPLQAITGEIRLGYEIPIAKKFSLELSPGFMYKLLSAELDANFDSNGGIELGKGITLRGGLKFYTSSKKNQTGLYISPLFLYKYFYSRKVYPLYPNSDLIQSIQMYGAQMLIGYMLQKNKFSIELYSGLGFKSVINSYKVYRSGSIDYEGTDRINYPTIQVGICVGYKLN